MPRIAKTPTVKTFVETWTKDFKAAVKKVAGKDGRLTMAEAQKIAKSTTGDKVFADNAINYLKATGKQSVSVEVLTASAKAYAERAAKAAAGTDGKITLKEGAKLSADLVEDFFMLRGKAKPGAVVPPPGGSAVAQAKASLEAATANLWMPSETDASFKFLTGLQLNGAPITEALVRAQLSAQHDAQLPQVMSLVDPARSKLATKTQFEERNASDYLNRLATNVDPNDPADVERGRKFAQLKTALESQLTDLKCYRFGEVEISTFFVGRTKTGELVALLTGQVET